MGFSFKSTGISPSYSLRLHGEPLGDFRAHVHLTTSPTRLDLFLLMYLLSELEAGMRT